MQETSLKKRYITKLLANIISGLVNAVLVAIVPKALGPVAYGQFVYLQDFFTKIFGFLDMGSSIAFFTKLSSRQERKELITFYFLYSFSILMVTVIFIFMIKNFNLTHNILPKIPEKFIFYGLFFGFLSWITQVFIKISDAYALTVSVELIKIGHKVFSLLLLLYFIYQLSLNLTSYYYYQYISLSIFLLILTAIFIKRNIFTNILNFKFSFLNLSKEFISYCHPLVVYNIIGVGVGIFDIWLLQTKGGSIQTGFYGLAYSLAAMCFLFTSAMTPIITREFAKFYEQRNIENMKKLFFRYVPMLYAISAYFAIFVSLQSENILAIFTDEKFKAAYPVLVIMSFYPIHQTYGQLSSSVFYAAGKTKLMRNVSIFSSILGVSFSVLLIYFLNLGAIGLAGKMILAQIIGVNIQLYFNGKFLKFKIQHFIFHQVYTIAFFYILAYVSSHLIYNFSPLINLLASGMLYTSLVIIFGYIFPQVFSTSRQEIKQNLYRLRNVIKK